MRVLITCGATWVPIDDVRVISNISTGEMGHLIAEAFARKGARVTLLEGPVTHALADKKVRVFRYRFFDELSRLLKQELGRGYDVVVHAAAVSDFRVAGQVRGKISSGKGLILRLVPTPKLIETVKRLAPGSFLVGFKLEPGLSLKNMARMVKPLFASSGCDLVVANSLTGGYKGFIVDARGKVLVKARSKGKLAEKLVERFKK